VTENLMETKMIDESTIRERAYVLWEKDACPEGAAEFYWHLAREQLEALVRPGLAPTKPDTNSPLN